jgi:hypothetical protein
LANPNVWTTEQIFAVSPSIPDGTTNNDPASYGQLLAVIATIAAKANITSPTFLGNPAAPTPTTPTGIATKSFVEALLSEYELGGDLAWRDMDIVRNAEGQILTVTDNDLLLVATVTWTDGNPTTITEHLNGVLRHTITLTWVDNKLTHWDRT